MRAVHFAMAIALLALVLPRPAVADPAIPPLTGRVVDAAHVLDDSTRNRIDGELASFEASSGIQFVVVTLPDLGSDTIEDWGLALGRGWSIGQKGKDNGVILIVAPKDRQLRIEVGYGLEGVLPDATANGIIRDTIVPRLRGGDVPGGILAGTEAIIISLGGKVEGAPAPSQLSMNKSSVSQFLRGFLPFVGFGFGKNSSGGPPPP